MVDTPTLILAFSLLIIASILLFVAGVQRRKAGLPAGQVIYTDTRGWGRVEKSLVDAELGLIGKPDYLVEGGDQVIPVEVKTGRTPASPYESHIFQLAVYCRLVHATTGKRPSHGLIHYPQRDFSVDYTPALESALLNLLAAMRRDQRRSNIPRSHQVAARCHGCGFRYVCDQKLD